VALKLASGWASALAIPMMLYGVWVARAGSTGYVALWVFFGASALHVLANVGLLNGHLFLLQFGILAGTVAAACAARSSSPGSRSTSSAPRARR